MNNSCAIGSVSRQISKTSERIDLIAMDMEQMEQSNQPELLATYEDLLFGELEQLQRLVLSLTSLIATSTAPKDDEGKANADEGDGSAFVEGDLAHEKAGVEENTENKTE